MYAFFSGEWRAAQAAVQGFDFDSSLSATTVAVSAASSASVAPSSSAVAAAPPTVDDVTLHNAWQVMSANAGMNWLQFSQFLRFHHARIRWMLGRPSHSIATATATTTATSATTLSPDVIASSLRTIEQVQSSMHTDGIDVLIERYQAQLRKDKEAELDTVEADDHEQPEEEEVQEDFIRENRDEAEEEEDDEFHEEGEVEEHDHDTEEVEEAEEEEEKEGWVDAGASSSSSSARPVEALTSQFCRVQVHDAAPSSSASSAPSAPSVSPTPSAPGGAAPEVIDAEHVSSESEEEFIPRICRPHGHASRARRTRIIADDTESEQEAEEHADTCADQEEQPDETNNDEGVQLVSWKSVVLPSTMPRQPSAVAANRFLPLVASSPSHPVSSMLQPLLPLQCSCPVHPQTTPASAAVAAASAPAPPSLLDCSDPSLSPSSSSSSENRAVAYLLQLFFQDLHAALDLPFIPARPLSLIAEYALPDASPSAASSSSLSASSSSTASSSVASSVAAALPPRRGPFFVVLTHYANGDTFSESFADDAAVLKGMESYARACLQRLREVEAEEGRGEAGAEDEEIDLKNNIHKLLQLLRKTNSNATAASSSSASASSIAPSPPSIDGSSLDDLLELAVSIGDDMIASQLGYGWTHVHECGVSDEEGHSHMTRQPSDD